jgi:molybdopterin-guanine dinucleotide biosynthesis adapter protein
VRTPIIAVSGPSGVGKTRLLSRLVAELTARGLRIGVLKHTGHDHAFDVPGKDTDVLRRAGAVATAIEGPSGMAYFGPPAGGARALARRLPPVDLVLAEGWKRDPLPRVEVHRELVSREFLCATDRRVFAVVSDVPPPRPVPVFGPDEVGALADLLCARCALASPRRGRARLRVRPRVSSLAPEGSERTIALGSEHMAKTTNRRSGGRGGARSTGRSGARTGGRTGAKTSRKTGTRSRSAAGRKGGTTTLRRRGPEFYSEIGRKGGKSRGRAPPRRTRTTRRAAAGGRRSGTTGRGGRKSTRGASR